MIAVLLAFDGVPSKESVQLPQTMSDGSKVAIGPLHVPADEASDDHRALLVGGGIVVLATAMYLNRRSRDRFESDRASSDEDDLSAAARGEERRDAGDE